MDNLDLAVAGLIRTRHSTRAFKQTPIPHEILEEVFSIAQQTASNSNIQPWRVTVVEGAAIGRLEKSLLAAFDANEKPEIRPIPEVYKKYRSEMGHALYGPKGYNIPRGAKEDMLNAQRRNYGFFGAPTGLILSLDSCLAPVDVLSVGLYLQTLILLLQERGIANCIQVSIAGYPREIRRELNIPDHMDVLCGVAIGYEDETHQINKLAMSRDEWQKGVRFVKV